MVQVEACGGSVEPILGKKERQKNKLPGLSASQKSVADFFSKMIKQILPSDSVPGVVCVDREVYFVCEKTL